jgi:hypothetical protein
VTETLGLATETLGLATPTLGEVDRKCTLLKRHCEQSEAIQSADYADDTEPLLAMTSFTDTFFFIGWVQQSLLRKKNATLAS